ncbi:MAG: MobA/MobL family protein [Brasilonema octagenarum HA4186-MV1]|jgi:hypothetical protein|nr:MobA/MobL family protein [Brasilonema octagenarum HA4186-MV1]
MAEQGFYRLEAKVISRGKGHSATGAAAYRAGERIVDEHTGVVHDYSRKQSIYHSEILAPVNVPEWVHDRAQLWNKVEETEWTQNRKKNVARLSREIVICFPNQMSHQEKLEAAREFVQKEFVWRGMVADVSFHDFEGRNNNNPHAHIMLTLRTINENGFGNINRDWNADELLNNWRERWAHHLNHHLERGGHDIRVEHRSYKAQGIERQPTIHEGKNVAAMRRKGKQTDLIRRNDEIKKLNKEIEQARQDLLLEQIKTNYRDQRRSKRVAEREENIQQLIKRSREAIAPTIAYQPSDNKSSLVDNKEMPKDSLIEPPKTKQYLTWHLVKQQIEAMGGDGKFEVGILNRQMEVDKQTGEVIPPKHPMRSWTFTKDSILNYDPATGKTPLISWLKYQNSQNQDIFIRLAPTEDGKQQGLFLIDDIDPASIEELKLRGLRFASVTETSHKNCQAWVRVTDKPVEKETATALAKMLTKAAGGDPGSASYQHYGRLAGFTNRKLEHLGVYNGKYGFPFVKLLESRGESMRNGEQWLTNAREAAAVAKQKQQEASALVAKVSKRQATDSEKEKALQVFRQIYQRARARGNGPDGSALDWATLKQMAKRGWSADALTYALSQGSDNLHQRKAGHAEDYINRTISRVFQDNDVLSALARRQERQADKIKQQLEQSIIPSNNKEKERERETEDQREIIEQFQKFKDRERSSRAAEPAKQPKQQLEERSGSSSSTGKENETTKTPRYHKGYLRSLREQRIIHPSASSTPSTQPREYKQVGELDAKTVEALSKNALSSEKGQAQIKKALWSLTQNTDTWHYKAKSEYGRLLTQCKAEYLKELGRMIRVHGKESAIDPSTDIEVGIKLRLAGFSVTMVYRTIREQSPLAIALRDDQSKGAYLVKGMKPDLQNSKVRTVVQNFSYERKRQAERNFDDPHKQHRYATEHRLDKLGLATVPEIVPETQKVQQHRIQHTPPDSPTNSDRER